MQALLTRLKNTRNNLRNRYPVGLESVNKDYARLEAIYYEITTYYGESIDKGWTNEFHQNSLREAIEMYLGSMIRFETQLLRSLKPDRIILLSDKEIEGLDSRGKVLESMEYFNRLDPNRDLLTYLGTKESMVCLHHPSRMLAVNWLTIPEHDCSAIRLRQAMTISH